ncbi:MAG TPA: hypothetical protein VL866_24465 [Pyrinomonadaceae bacterium]|nr:hypothetical protein [Pyrinomonadaceae bacterium]
MNDNFLARFRNVNVARADQDFKDYDPPYLSNEQTHTLLTIEPPDWKLSLTAIEIEAMNVAKMETQ